MPEVPPRYHKHSMDFPDAYHRHRRRHIRRDLYSHFPVLKCHFPALQKSFRDGRELRGDALVLDGETDHGAHIPALVRVAAHQGMDRRDGGLRS